MQLNYFPINIEFEKYQINTELYSDERLTELRGLYNATHSFLETVILYTFPTRTVMTALQLVY